MHNPVPVQNQLHTLRDFIRYAASRFNEAGLCFGHGTDNAIDEAAALVLHALHLPPDLHGAYHDGRLIDSEKQAILELVQRRVQERKPLAYLTHEAWFAGLAFYVDERVLIPRSPIAELIDNAFSPWIETARVQRIVDIGTGSGCIGIACAHTFPDAVVDMTDLSAAALEVATINVERHHLQARTRLLRSDLYAALAGETYDLIISNPPYVAAATITQLPAEYRCEPETGLAAGVDGLDFAVPLLRDGARHLNAGGLLVVEVGDSAEALMQRFPDIDFLWPEFTRGGGGVFIIDKENLQRYHRAFSASTA